jgi:hypothetical protein
MANDAWSPVIQQSTACQWRRAAGLLSDGQRRRSASRRTPASEGISQPFWLDVMEVSNAALGGRRFPR